MSYASADCGDAELTAVVLEKTGCEVRGDRTISRGEVYIRTTEQTITGASD